MKNRDITILFWLARRSFRNFAAARKGQRSQSVSAEPVFHHRRNEKELRHALHLVRPAAGGCVRSAAFAPTTAGPPLRASLPALPASIRAGQLASDT